MQSGVTPGKEPRFLNRFPQARHRLGAPAPSRSLSFASTQSRSISSRSRLRERPAARRQPVFDGAEPPLELGVRAAQRRLGIDAIVAREVGDREQQVADLVLDPSVRRGSRGLFDLVEFLADLGDDLRRRASRTRPWRPCWSASRRGSGRAGRPGRRPRKPPSASSV